MRGEEKMQSRILTDQATFADSKTSGRKCPQSLPAMGVANGARQGIGSIGGRNARKIEQADDHGLHLLLGRLAVPNHGLLDLQRRIFGHRQPGMDQGADRRPAGLPEHQGRLRIDIDEHLLDRRLGRAIRRNHFGDSGKQGVQTLRQAVVGSRPDTTTGDITEAVAALFDDAESGHAQPGVNAKNAKGRHPSARKKYTPASGGPQDRGQPVNTGTKAYLMRRSANGQR